MNSVKQFLMKAEQSHLLYQILTFCFFGSFHYNRWRIIWGKPGNQIGLNVPVIRKTAGRWRKQITLAAIAFHFNGRSMTRSDHTQTQQRSWSTSFLRTTSSQTLCTNLGEDFLTEWLHSQHCCHHNLQRWSPPLSLFCWGEKVVLSSEKKQKVSSVRM